MRKAFIIIALCLIGISCKKDQTTSPAVYNCEGAIEATSTLRLAAAKIAVIQMEGFNISGKDTVFIPERHISSFENQLMLIQQVNKAISDSIFVRYRIPDNFYNRTGDLRYVTVWVRGGAWSDSLISNGTSGDEDFNALMNKFSIKVEAYAKETPQFGPYLYRLLLKTCQPVNIFALRREFEKHILVDRVEAANINGTGTISTFRSGINTSRYDFGIWYDDCPNQCKRSHHWVFDVINESEAFFVIAYGDPAP